MIKKGDNVIVIAGKDRKKSGTVSVVFPKISMIVVSGINIKKRHTKARKGGAKGTIVESEAPIHISNVKLEDSSVKKEQKKQARKKPEKEEKK